MCMCHGFFQRNVNIVFFGQGAFLCHILFLKHAFSFFFSQDFISWMSDACKTLNKSAVILACHEPTRKVLIPLLLGALVKYNLMEQFSKVVKGFVNGVNIVKRFGDMNKVTSFSLRSLCKTVLQVRTTRSISLCVKQVPIPLVQEAMRSNLGWGDIPHCPGCVFVRPVIVWT